MIAQWLILLLCRVALFFFSIYLCVSIKDTKKQSAIVSILEQMILVVMALLR